MRHTHAGTAGKIFLTLLAALVLTMAFAVVVSARPAEPLAPDAPNLPHFFQGTVTTDLGVPLPGVLVAAQAVTGAWSGTSTTTVNSASKYGYAPNFLYIPGYDPGVPGSGAKPGDQIAFFVNGVQATLYDVAAHVTLTTYPFAIGADTELNLIVPLYYTITPSAGAGCIITPGTAQIVPYKGSQSFTIGTLAAYDLVDVLVNGVSQGPITSYNFTNVTSNGTISATCKLKPFVITPTAGPHGTITPATPQTVEYGSNVTFTIAPDGCYAIDDVLVDGVSQGPVASYTFANVTANHTIHATFKLKTFVITPTAGPHGTITPGTPQTVNCGGGGTFTIAADTGYDIVDVLVDGVSQGPITSYAFTNVTANRSISAVFTKQEFIITPIAGTGGTVTPGTPQTVTYGSSISFQVAADSCYVINDVLVDGASQGPIASYTFTNVTAHHTIEAKFTIKTFVITPTAGSHGAITPGTAQTVNCGSSAAFTITPNTGYKTVDVTVDGVSQGVITAYTFTNVTANHAIDATFAMQYKMFLPFIAREAF